MGHSQSCECPLNFGRENNYGCRVEREINMPEEAMSLEQFRQAKATGVDLTAQPEVEEDAAPIEQDIQQEQEDPQEITQEHQEEVDDEPQIPQEQQSAWSKRAERERRKAAEETETRLKSEYEAQINPYKAFFDQLGVTPEQALASIEQNRIKQEAENLAYQNGWDEQQTQMYMRQQELERKQTDMTVNLRVYELSETPDYPGIKQMKGAITDFIRANPRVPVEQAYWAVGGANLATQLKREAEQREIAKRGQTKRTVISDAPTDMKGPEPLTPEAVAFMRRTGMSEDQVRMMMKDEGPSNLEEYRKMMKTKKG